MPFRRIGKVFIILFMSLLLILFMNGCGTANKDVIQKDIKDLPISAEKIDPNSLFVEYDNKVPNPDITTNSKGEKVLQYNLGEQAKVNKRVVDSKQNLDSGKVVVEKYNILVDQISACNGIYKQEQEQKYAYQQQLKNTQDVLEKEQKWNKIENKIITYSMIIIAIGVIALAL